MSWQAVNAVMERSRAKSSELLMMFILASYADEKNECFPSFRTLARNARMSERQVVRIVRRLTQLGEIQRIAAGGGRASNRYRLLLLPPPDQGASSATHVRSDKLSEQPYDTPALPTTCHGNSVAAVSNELSSNKDGTVKADGIFFDREWLNDLQFREAWLAFLEVRRRKRAANSDFALRQIGRTLTSFGKAKAIIALTKSAVAEWPDVYEPKNLSSRAEKTRGPKPKPTITEAEFIRQNGHCNAKGQAHYRRMYNIVN